MFDPEIYRQRRKALRDRIRSGLVVFLGNEYSPINYPGNAYRFRQDSNFLYYFGLDKASMVGTIDIEGGQDTLYADDPTMDDIIWMGPQPSVSELASSVGVTSTRALHEIECEIHSAIRKGRRVHFLNPYRAEHLLTLGGWLGLDPRAVKNYVSNDLVHAVIAQRAVKEPCEIAELDRIAEYGYQMHVTAMRLAQPGVREQYIAGILEGIATSFGHQTSFSTILSQNGETLHNEDHSQVLQEGRLLLVDAGVESNLHYATDNTRTIPVGGTFTPQQQHIYETVLRALEQGIALSKPRVKYIDVHREVCKTITQGLIDAGIMRGSVEDAVQNGAHALFFPHGLGHMLGLDTHDMEGLGEDNVGYDQETVRSGQFGTASLRCGRRLQEGFVITVEPGIYFIPALIEKWEKEKINTQYINFEELKHYQKFGGIRLEDNILITQEGSRILGAPARIPVTPAEVIQEVAKGRQ